jgi:hypothetical protein
MLTSLALVVAGCGGKGKEQAEKGKAITCDGKALSGTVGLPSDFPTWDEVTFVKTEKVGPTLIVEGFFDGDLKSAHDEYVDRFDAAHYTVLFEELEDKDSEVSYKDSAGKTTGQVALKDECANGHISVRITSRPA